MVPCEYRCSQVYSLGMKQTTIRVDDALWAKMEFLRGDVPRNTWICRLIEDRVVQNSQTSSAVLAKLNAVTVDTRYEGVPDRDLLTPRFPQHALNCQCPVCKPPKEKR
jgi:hypothetical protein